MPSALRQSKVARVLFDESHAEAWSIRPEAAAAMRPAHPEASSYSAAASAVDNVSLLSASEMAYV